MWVLLGGSYCVDVSGGGGLGGVVGVSGLVRFDATSRLLSAIYL